MCSYTREVEFDSQHHPRRENMEDVEKLDVVGVGTEKVEEEVTEQT